jgi:hypothetical protein
MNFRLAVNMLYCQFTFKKRKTNDGFQRILPSRGFHLNARYVSQMFSFRVPFQ